MAQAFDSSSLFPKEPDQPNITVSHIINSSDLFHEKWNKTTGISHDSIGSVGYPDTYQAGTSVYPVPGYEHRNDNDLGIDYSEHCVQLLNRA